jgi:hypothetical protein
MPLVIANASAIGQPLRLQTGPHGALVGLELSSAGEVAIPRKLSVGPGIGAGPQELMRVGALTATGGTGVVIDMRMTDSTTGLAIRDIGFSGSHHAGMSITSASNGVGTGIRIGGPTGTGRATVATGIDIVGGTGLRYNALVAGQGTAVDIGSTMSPQRGIDITVSGNSSVGLTARSNLLGVGIVGVSRSGTTEEPTLRPRTGVHGHAASNSAVAADNIAGVLGTVLRGGVGGSATVSIGVDGLAEGLSTANAGLSVGVRGRAISSNVGSALAIGGLFEASPSMPHLAVAARRGNTYLGSALFDRPPGLPIIAGGVDSINLSTTWMFRARISGSLSLVGASAADVAIVAPTSGRYTLRLPASMPIEGDALIAHERIGDTISLSWRGHAAAYPWNLVPGVDFIGALPINASIIRIVVPVAGGTIIGIQAPPRPVIVTVISLGGPRTLVNESLAVDAENRIVSFTGANCITDGDASATLWYDDTSDRWRLITFNP